MTATEIADLIDLVVESSVRGAEWTDIEIQRFSNLNRALWDLARKNGIEKEVDSILYERAVLEVFKAIDKIS
jgi:hypothetical protein